MPAAWANAFGARRTTLGLSGRNLATLTSYSGPDPEVNSFGSLDGPAMDLFAQTPRRQYSARVVIEF